jgi:hypothetical protein
MNRAIFEAYVETQLAPTLKPGDVVILDNLAARLALTPRRDSGAVPMAMVIHCLAASTIEAQDALASPDAEFQPRKPGLAEALLAPVAPSFAPARAKSATFFASVAIALSLNGLLAFSCRLAHRQATSCRNISTRGTAMGFIPVENSQPGEQSPRCNRRQQQLGALPHSRHCRGKQRIAGEEGSWLQYRSRDPLPHPAAFLDRVLEGTDRVRVWEPTSKPCSTNLLRPLASRVATAPLPMRWSHSLLWDASLVTAKASAASAQAAAGFPLAKGSGSVWPGQSIAIRPSS